MQALVVYVLQGMGHLKFKEDEQSFIPATKVGALDVALCATHVNRYYGWAEGF